MKEIGNLTKQSENKYTKHVLLEIDNTKYLVNLFFKKDSKESYKDKILKLLKRDIEKK